MSNYKQIDEAVKIFNNSKCPFELMHSISAYPSPENELNLNIIKKLKDKYNCEVGYSGRGAFSFTKYNRSNLRSNHIGKTCCFE